MKSNIVLLMINLFAFGCNILMTSHGKHSAVSECFALGLAAFWSFMYFWSEARKDREV